MNLVDRHRKPGDPFLPGQIVVFYPCAAQELVRKQEVTQNYVDSTLEVKEDNGGEYVMVFQEELFEHMWENRNDLRPADQWEIENRRRRGAKCIKKQ